MAYSLYLCIVVLQLYVVVLYNVSVVCHIPPVKLSINHDQLSVYISLHCPFHYCLPPSHLNYNLSTPNTQC